MILRLFREVLCGKVRVCWLFWLRGLLESKSNVTFEDRNCLFLETKGDAFYQSWFEGWGEAFLKINTTFCWSYFYEDHGSTFYIFATFSKRPRLFFSITLSTFFFHLHFLSLWSNPLFTKDRGKRKKATPHSLSKSKPSLSIKKN